MVGLRQWLTHSTGLPKEQPSLTVRGTLCHHSLLDLVGYPRPALAGEGGCASQGHTPHPLLSAHPSYHYPPSTSPSVLLREGHVWTKVTQQSQGDKDGAGPAFSGEEVDKSWPEG